MELRLPLPPQVSRSVGIHHWCAGLAKFDGRNPIRVFIKEESTKDKWISTIEKLGPKVMCVTRFNGTVKEMFDSAVLVSY